jgi:hypothetical protein
MVGAPRDPSPHSMGPIIDISFVDGGHAQTFGTASQGVRYRCFLALMVALSDLQHHLLWGPPLSFLVLVAGAPRSPAPPPRGPVVDISKR